LSKKLEAELSIKNKSESEIKSQYENLKEELIQINKKHDVFFYAIFMKMKGNNKTKK